MKRINLELSYTLSLGADFLSGCINLGSQDPSHWFMLTHFLQAWYIECFFHWAWRYKNDGWGIGMLLPIVSLYLTLFNKYLESNFFKFPVSGKRYSNLLFFKRLEPTFILRLKVCNNFLFPFPALQNNGLDSSDAS